MLKRYQNSTSNLSTWERLITPCAFLEAAFVWIPQSGFCGGLWYENPNSWKRNVMQFYMQ